MKNQVATTILNQLGGNRFAVMTGAKNFVATSDGVSFAIGKNAKGINRVVITLTPMDDYKVDFWNVRNAAITEKAKFTGVYCDQLQEIFTAATGMYTRLF